MGLVSRTGTVCAVLHRRIAGAERLLDDKRGRSPSQVLRWFLGPFSVLRAQILRNHQCF